MLNKKCVEKNKNCVCFLCKVSGVGATTSSSNNFRIELIYNNNANDFYFMRLEQVYITVVSTN